MESVVALRLQKLLPTAYFFVPSQQQPIRRRNQFHFLIVFTVLSSFFSTVLILIMESPTGVKRSSMQSPTTKTPDARGDSGVAHAFAALVGLA